MSEIPLRFRKKAYEPGTDSLDGIVTFDSESKKIYLGSDAYGNVQADWQQTIGTEPDFIKNKPTIGSGVLTIQKNGTTIGTFSADDASDKTVNITMATVATSGLYSDLTGTPTIGTGTITITDGITSIGSFNANETNDTDVDISQVLYQDTTYVDLVARRNHNALVKGQKYRIIDYITTTNSSNNLSDDTYTAVNAHAFDLVVTAIDTDKLDHRAVALPHSGDKYFTNAGADLSKWQVWYDIDNDTTKYAWADNKEGTGVIYRLIDEWGNDCPYDFKNIQFKRKLTDGALDENNGEKTWVYTFNAWNVDDSVIEDASLITNSVLIGKSSNSCYNNVISVYRNSDSNVIPHMALNDIVFLNTYAFKGEVYFECYSNTFGDDCRFSTFGNSCCSNTFGDYCHHNTFGYGCHSNTFGNTCESNTFGNQCHYNNFENYCESNTFGDYCSYNTLGNSCRYIRFGNSSNQGGTYCHYNIVENGNRNIRLYQTGTAGSTNNQLQNVYIAQGVNNTATWYDISTISRNLSYRTTVAKLSNGTRRIYREDEDDIPNSGVLTVQSNGVTIGTFSANDAADKTVNITMATVAATGLYSDLIGTPTLATVATSGSYNDLTDKPTISTVNDGVLTIQSNGVTIGTFSANEESAKTINIEAQALAEEITYSDLVTKIGSQELVEGQQYRITDYVTTTKNGINADITLSTVTYKSAGHPFDLIVTATSDSTLDCCAKAVPNSGDSYFTSQYIAIDKWQVWYDINNDTYKYEWADTTNGKGVIYRMIDESGNDLPYDFKNIMFKRKLDSNGDYDTTNGTDNWVYTLNHISSDMPGSFDISDASLQWTTDGPKYNNMGSYAVSEKLYLNNNVLLKALSCHHNTFGVNCFNNTFTKRYCSNNTFGDYCCRNTFELHCSFNTFGDGCADNVLKDYCVRNTFGNDCCNNTFDVGGEDNYFMSNCGSNSFGDLCLHNTFGVLCSDNSLGGGCSINTFGDGAQHIVLGQGGSYNKFNTGCSYITLGLGAQSNTFGNNCFHITLGDGNGNYGTFVKDTVIENGCEYIRLYNSDDPNNNGSLQNIYIAQSVAGTANDYVTISSISRGLPYRTTVGMTTPDAGMTIGTLRIYNEDDPVVVTSALSQLTDVQIGTLVDGQSLVYDSASGKWVNQSLIKVFEFNTMVPPAQIPSMIASAQAGFIVKVKIGNDYFDLISYNATNQTIYAGKVGLGDDGNVYKYTLNGYVVTQAINGSSVSYDMGLLMMASLETDDLADIAISTSTLADGDTLVYNATTQKWVNGQSSGGATIEIRTWTSN